MPRYQRTRTGDVVTVPDALVKRYDEDPRYEPVEGAVATAPGSSSEPGRWAVDGLKGAALDRALKDAGLSTSGTADEKRSRLATHIDGQD